MKKVCLKIGLVALALALVFGVALIVLSVNREYAKLHYRQTHRFDRVDYYGCGKNDCKYCSGQVVGGSYLINRKSESLFYDFLYFKTLTAFWIASIVLTAVCGVTSCVTIPLHFTREKTRRTDKEDY